MGKVLSEDQEPSIQKRLALMASPALLSFIDELKAYPSPQPQSPLRQTLNNRYVRPSELLSLCDCESDRAILARVSKGEAPHKLHASVRQRSYTIIHLRGSRLRDKAFRPWLKKDFGEAADRNKNDAGKKNNRAPSQ